MFLGYAEKHTCGLRATRSDNSHNASAQFVANYHLTLVHRSRQDGYSAHERARYVARLGRYESRADLVHVESVHLPPWVQSHDREALAYWSAADEYERANARLYSEYEASLPRELTREQQIELARLLAEHVSVAPEGKMPCTWAIHDKGDGNPHVHIMRSDRALDGHARSPDTWFRRAATGKKSAEEGGARKVKSVLTYFSKQHLLDVREWWSQAQNQALSRAGSDARVDHRTLIAQGITHRTATSHLGRTAFAYIRKGREDLLNTETQLRIEHNRIAKHPDVVNIMTLDTELRAAEREVDAETLFKQMQTDVRAAPAPRHVAIPAPTPAPEALEASSDDRYRPTYRSPFPSPPTRGRRTFGSVPSFNSVRALPGRDVAYDPAERRDGPSELLPRHVPQDLGATQDPRGTDGLRRAAPAGGAGRRGRVDLEALVAQLLANAQAPSILGCAMVAPVVIVFWPLSAAAPSVRYEAVRGRAGMLYVRKSAVEDTLVLVDRGNRIVVRQVDDADSVRAGLALAASKWTTGALRLSGPVEFQALAVREAVRLGLGHRLAKELPPELNEVRQKALADLATARRKQAATAPAAPASAAEATPKTPTLPSSPAATSRPRPKPR